MEQDGKYIFSVIVPAYKVERYIAETLDSVINQTIGFTENIQIIIVNDGSPDNTKEICEEYVKRFPENIVYVEQENSGVSAARNNGLNYATGKYINFLDSDDMWEKDVFEKVYNMFKKNSGIPIIGVRQKHFEASQSYATLDYKYKNGDRIVDVEKEWENIQLSVTSAFVDRDYIGDIRFDSRIKYSEDARFIYEILINNKATKYGLIGSSIHLYRKRYEQNSAIQTKDTKEDWYFVTTKLCYQYLIDLAKEKAPELLKTIAYYIAYDYQWRVKADIGKYLSEKQIEEYLSITSKLFSCIDDDIILAQMNTNLIWKNLMIEFKYGTNKELDAAQMKWDKTLRIDIFEGKNGKICLEGYFFDLLGKNEKLVTIINGKEEELPIIDRVYPEIKSYFKVNEKYVSGFKIQCAIEELESIKIGIKRKNEFENLPISFGRLAKLSNLKNSYYCYKNKIVYLNKYEFKFENNTFLNRVKHELKYDNIIKNKKAIIIRWLYFITKPFYKNIWIFSDRQNVAGDNGEVMFRYINEQKEKKPNTYFVISKDSEDSRRLMKYGKVVDYSSLKYKLLFLHCNLLVSSHFKETVIKAFGKTKRYYTDLINYKYAFLQHGIIKDDISGYTNKYNYNMKMFVTSAEAEYNSIINGNYGYDESIVKLTGLPRYDNLVVDDDEVKTKRQILMLPTWRSYLAGPEDPKTQQKMYSEKFKDTEYFKFYNNLINDERLLKKLKEKNYTMKFALHPMHKVQTKDYKSNEFVTVENKNLNYQQEFINSRLLITDYSSTAWDFAYLRRPTIYARFDEEEFYKNHTYTKGYFDEEIDGFGPVCHNYEQTVQAIIDMIDNDFRIEDRYIKNINKFFKYNDNKNSLRNYEELKRLSLQD